MFKITEKQLENIINKYQANQNLTVKDIAKEYGVSSHCLLYRLRQKNIQIRRRFDHNRKYFFDFNYFDKIDCERKAYWLGFIAADGHVASQKGRRTLAVSSHVKDKEHLQKFAKDLNSPLKVVIRFDKRSENQQLAVLQVYSEKITTALLNVGFTRRKTWDLKWEPIERVVPKELMNHFIRGFFDGDGCIYVNNEKGYNSFSVSCKSTDFLMKLNSFICEKSKITTTKLIYKKDCDIFNMYKSGRNNLLKIYKFLYKNATIWLERKRDKFEILNHSKSESL